MEHDSSNMVFKLAADFVNNTSRHVFLTGKAGTGKTTFLRYIKQHSNKNTVVVAPTGVAAINAAGVTMHSFFQLPFGPFIPASNKGFTDSNDITDIHSLFTNIRFNADKRTLLQELELLIIDEISMVRADMLDAVDLILRYFRKKPALAFGGVQVLYIGDMYQLPPVVPPEEWTILQEYYESPFFFSARVIEASQPLYIELKKIYRQSEQVFIDILNRVRNNNVTDEDFYLLHQRHQPGFRAPEEDKYITLCTHNRNADAINVNELAKLPGNLYCFKGTITGEFSDKALPTDLELKLKTGAQVMFIKNDSGSEKRYFNGKLATVKNIHQDEISVITNDTGQELKIEKETWRNIRYSYHKEKDKIEEEELGSFSQYPLRLAWAITIHKSQGLTFNKAIIDAGSSFAAGQVYVALSRCTSIDGMVLLSRIHPSAIATDPRVIAFAKKEAASEELHRLLEGEQQQYISEALIRFFDWKKIQEPIEDFIDLVPTKKLPATIDGKMLCNQLKEKVKEQAVVAGRFQLQLQQLLTELTESGDTSILEDRVSKAIAYFVQSIGTGLIKPLEEHLAAMRLTGKSRKYVNELTIIIASIRTQVQKMIHLKYGDLVFCKDPAIFEQHSTVTNTTSSIQKQKKPKPVKGDSQLESLTLYKKGIPIKEIAALRQLAETTISGHLANFVGSGELDILEFVPIEKLNQILPVVKEIGGEALGPIKERLNDDCSFNDIRYVLKYWMRMKDETVNP